MTLCSQVLAEKTYPIMNMNKDKEYDKARLFNARVILSKNYAGFFFLSNFLLVKPNNTFKCKLAH